MSATIIPFPSDKCPHCGSPVERDISSKSPTGIYCWFGAGGEFGYPWPNVGSIPIPRGVPGAEPEPIGNLAQIVAVVHCPEQFDEAQRGVSVGELEEKSGGKWSIIEEYEIENLADDGRRYFSLILRKAA